LKDLMKKAQATLLWLHVILSGSTKSNNGQQKGEDNV
jgi:hypothetical protein